MITIELDYDQREHVVRETLIEMVEERNFPDGFDPKMIEAVERLIAYMSVHGEYKGGKYD